MQLKQHDERVADPTTGETIAHKRQPALLAVVIAAVLLALGFAIGRVTAPEAEQPKAIASPEVTAMLRDRVNAVNTLGPDAIASFYAEDAVLEEMDQSPPVVTTGNDAIGSHLHDYVDMGFRLEALGAALQNGKYVTEVLDWSGGGGVAVYEIDENLKITHQWVLGGS
jgi:hypothetical protein